MEDETLASGNLLQAFAVELLASRLQTEIGGLAGAAAIAPPRRELRAIECGENLDGAGGAVLYLQLQPVAAALRAGPAGIRTELLAPEQQRRGGFDDLHRRALHAAGIGGGREPGLTGPRAGAAIGDDGDGEAALHLVSAAAERHQIDAGRDLGRDAVGDRLAQTAEDDVRQHLTDDVAQGYRRWRQGVDDAVGWRRHGIGGQ